MQGYPQVYLIAFFLCTFHSSFYIYHLPSTLSSVSCLYHHLCIYTQTSFIVTYVIFCPGTIVRAKPKGQQKRKADEIPDDSDVEVMTLTAKIPKVLRAFAGFLSQNKVTSLASARRNSILHKPTLISSGKNHHFQVETQLGVVGISHLEQHHMGMPYF